MVTMTTTGGGPAIYYNRTVLGTCSLCGGPVTVPTVWHGIIPPVPTCGQCGATAKQSFGPVIPMERGRTWTSPTITWSPNTTIRSGSTVHW